jgi:Yip1 domain.
MIHRISDMLFRPDTFFKEWSTGEGSLKIPAVIVLIGGIISAILGYLVSGIYAKMFVQGAGEGMASLLGIIGGVSAFFGFLIMWWVVLAGVFFILSRFFKGEGDFKRILEVVSFGLVPVIIGSLISLGLSLYYIPLVKVPVLKSFTDPVAVQTAMEKVLLDPAYKEFMLVTVLISVIFIFWGANIWIFGMKYARNLTLKNSALTVGIPVGIYVIYILVTAVFGISLFGGQ